MQTKAVIRTVFISLMLSGLVLAGVYAFLKLRTGEQVYHTDVFDLVSDGNELLFHFTRPERLPGNFPRELLPDTTYLPLIADLCHDQTRKLPGAQHLILSFRGKDGLVLYRATPDQIDQWEKNMQLSGFFPFPFMEMRRGDIDYKVSLTADDRFFCYTYHNGAFLGSYSRSLLEDALDMFSSEGNAMNNPSFVQARRSVSKTSFAECYFKEKAQWYGLDLTENKGNVWFSGCLLPGQVSERTYRTAPAQAAHTGLSVEFIPATTSALVFFHTDSIQSDNDSEANALLKKYCTGNAVISYYTSIDTTDTYFRTCCLELNDRYHFLRELKKLLPGSQLASARYVWHRNDDYILYNLYRLPEDFSLSAAMGNFSRKEDAYFTFYKNNLLISDSQEALLQYWKQLHTRHSLPPDAPLLQAYQTDRSEEASLFVIASKEALQRHPLASKELLPQAFSRMTANHVFIQFIVGENLLLYNGRLF